jgi:hypothetical protein
VVLVQVLLLEREREQERVFVLLRKRVEVLLQVVEPIHELEKALHMGDQLDKVLVVEQVQHMDDLLVPALVLVEEQAHRMVLGK